jgi:S1-C subfamily serine protease
VTPAPSDPYTAPAEGPADPYEAPKPLRAELTRRELTAAIEDFGSVVLSVRGELTPQGARVDEVVKGSLLARLGLLPGDVIAAVDGKPLRTLDDTATLYARLASTIPTLRQATLELVRGGKPLTLQVVIAQPPVPGPAPKQPQ